MVEFQKSIVSRGFQIGKQLRKVNSSTNRFREHEMEILYLGGVEAFIVIKRGFSPASSFQVKGS